MNDVFVEQLIEQRQSMNITIKKIGIILAALLISAVFLFFGVLRMFFPFVFAASLYGAVVLVRMQNLEFEYSFTNGDLDVDRIIGRRCRKKELSVSVRSFEIMAPMTEAFRREYESQTIGKTVDASSSPKSESRWFAKFRDEAGTVTLLIFEPNERVVEAIRKFIPRKIMDGKS
jgi:hypothetical protein